MIRARPVFLASLAILVPGVTFGQRPAAAELAAPQLRAATTAAFHARAIDALEALDRLEETMAPALDAGRRGSARVVAGDASPGPPMLESAESLEAATDEAESLATRLAAVRGSTGATGEPISSDPVTASELESIARQLTESAAAGDEFAAMRRRAAAVGPLLQAALDSMTSGDTSGATELLAQVRQHHDELSGWEPGLVTLPIWLGTTNRLLDASQRLLDAIEAGDPGAVEAAGAEVAQLGAEAREADVALVIAMSEGGGAIAATPLRRLAQVLSRAERVRAELVTILQGAPPAQ